MNASNHTGAFYEFNEGRKQQLLSTLNKQQTFALEVLPVLFHINLNLLPGYVNKYTPCGVFDYLPDEKTIDIVKRLNANFGYQHIEAIKDYDIESLFLQQAVISNHANLWIIHNKDLEYDAIKLLEHKSRIVEDWLTRFNLDIVCKVCSVSNFVSHGYGHQSSGFHIDKSFFLDIFYTESILLAGKSPQWWVPDSLTSDDSDDAYINLGDIKQIRYQDYLSAAIWCLYNSELAPESYWLQLLLVYHRCIMHPETDNLSARLKDQVLTSSNPATIAPDDIIPEFINEILDSYKHTFEKEEINQILYTVCQYIIDDKNQNSIYHKLYDLRNDKNNLVLSKLRDTQHFIKNLENLYKAISSIYSHIEDLVVKNNPDILKGIPGLETISNNLLSRHQKKTGKISIYNNRDQTRFLEDRVTIAHNTNDSRRKEWIIIRSNQQNQPVEIESFNNLINLITWSVLNGFINKSTRVSVYCPNLQVRQTDIIELIGIISDQFLTPDHQTPINTFVTEAETEKSAYIIHNVDYLTNTINSKISDKQYNQKNNKSLRFIEIRRNNWGEVFIEHYQGMAELLKCLFNSISTKPVKSYSAPEFNFSIYGIINGTNKAIARQTKSLIDNLCDYFFNQRKFGGKYIFKRDHDYYLVENINKTLSLTQIGNYSQLTRYFEQKRSFSSSLKLEHESFINSPIPLILELNKRRSIQLFFRIDNNMAEVYVADEHSTLHIHTQPYYEKQRFINQWLLFFLNTQNRLGKIHVNDRRTSSIEISEIMLNQNNEYMVVPLDIQIPPPADKCYDIRLEVKGESSDRQLALILNEQKFSSKDYGERIFSEFINYFKAHIPLTGRYPVYLTDIDAPIEMFKVESQDDIHMLNFIKYKKNIENRLNELARKIN